MLISPELPFHPGEKHLHQVMKHSPSSSATSPFLTPNGAFLLSRAPLLAVGALDAEGRPWTTLWGSDTPFAQVLGENVIGVKAKVDARHDPVVEILMRGRDADDMVKLDVVPGDEAPASDRVRRFGGLTIDLETRKRVKLAGRLMVGVLEGNGSGNGETGVAEMTLVTRIDESLGNCPKYLNKKHIVSAEAEPNLVSDSIQLPEEAIKLLAKSDLFFVTSSHERVTMDTNHRGGPPGFVRVLSNDASGAVLVWPDYSGNRLYQTMGNFISTPAAGLVFPDFDSGDVLYVTGIPEVLVGPEAAAILPRSNMIAKVKITGARFVQNGLSFRGKEGEFSPYNPAVRFAATEKATAGIKVSAKRNNAILLSKTDLTPTISRFRFKIEDPSLSGRWEPGQYATLSFADELDVGYSHMREDDPRSLNDDYIRTFTISSPPSRRSMEGGSADEEFELTVRKVGTATEHLFRQNPRAGFELALNGFEGEFKFEKKEGDGKIPVVTAGIGVTPMLGQIEYIDLSRLILLWSTGIVDIGLVADTLKRYPELSKHTTVFVTGNTESAGQSQKDALEQVAATGVKIEKRRINKEDLDEVNKQSGVDEWYMCVGPALKASVLKWLDGRRVVYEDFNY